ncbi:MAG: dihydroorotase [Bacteroidales bacterium]
MQAILIKNATIVNEGDILKCHVLCANERIDKIFREEPRGFEENSSLRIIDAEDKILIPGVIDDQVHFREPGLTHKADINTESKAAVAGGVTSFMEMPNTSPATTTIALLEEKIKIAEKSSLANYSFYLGASNDNIDELTKADPQTVCGIKIFMGSSTGNMLVDDDATLRSVFSKIKIPVAVHCEDEPTIQANILAHKRKYGDRIPMIMHPAIRSEEACWLSSSYAVELAREYGTRLHVLHISTEKELELFDSMTPYEKKKITAEACVHHLWFDQSDYAKLGTKIKWNPAIKTGKDRKALIKAVTSGAIDVIATDHAPHTADEKSKSYFEAPSGGPMVQHSLVAMMELVSKNHLSMEKLVEKMCHAPATIFSINERGFIREGYYADLVLLDRNSPWTVGRENILYKCGWSPMEGVTFNTKITHTIVNGHIVYENGIIDRKPKSKQLTFNR